MKGIQHAKTYLPALGMAVAVGLGVSATILGERLASPLSGLSFGLAGALGGLSGARLLTAHFDRTWTPEERKEIERAEKDERNVTIREKAAYSSWYWTLYLLWGAFFLTLVLGSGFPTALVSVVIVLHCVFYMVNMNRWTKKL
ncbi:MAG: hypothetical protein ACOX7N_00320 [Lawsonibacter sp.]|jgi:hypothetical protein